MEGAVEIAKLLQTGGPWAMAALAIAAWIWERRENKALTKSILELATAQTEAVLKHEASMGTLKELLSVLIGRGHG